MRTRRNRFRLPAAAAVPGALALLLLVAPPAAPEARAASAGSGSNTTVVTSDRLTYDYRQSMAVFEGNVVVTDSQIRIEADRITLVFIGTNELKSAEAVGRVRLTQEDKSGRCNRLTYSAETGRLVMTGNAVLERPSIDWWAADEIAFLVQNNEVQSVKATGNVRFSHRGTGSGKTPDLLQINRKKPAAP